VRINEQKRGGGRWRQKNRNGDTPTKKKTEKGNQKQQKSLTLGKGERGKSLSFHYRGESGEKGKKKSFQGGGRTAGREKKGEQNVLELRFRKKSLLIHAVRFDYSGGRRPTDKSRREGNHTFAGK